MDDQRRGEQRQEDRSSLLRQILDTASVGIFLVDKAGRITHANRRMAEMFLRPLAEMVGCEYVDLVHPSERETGRRTMLALLASEIESVDVDRRYWRRDGSSFWGHLSGRRFHDARGADIGLIGVIADITAQKEAQERLQASESRYRAIVDTQAEFVVRYAPGGILTFVNDTLCRYAGMTREQLIGTCYHPFIHPDDREALIRDVAALDREHPSMIAEARIVLPDGRVTWHQWTHHAIFDAEGSLVEYQCTGRDVTEVRRTEAALRESEAKYRRLYNETPVLLHSIDRDARLVEVNDHWLRTLGYERAEVIGRKVTDFYTPASRRYAEEVVLPAFFRDGFARDVPYQFIRKDGGIVEVMLSATGERDAEGGVVRSQAVILDVTERRRTAEALRYSEARFRAIIEGASVGILAADVDGRAIRYANPQICRMLGYPEQELLALTVPELVAPEEADESVARFRAHVDGRTRTSERTFRRRDGSPVRVAISTVRVELEGRATLVGFFTDITERRLLEAERLKSQKLESVGTLAGGIAHDFNNLLQGVFGYISVARLAADDRERSLAMLAKAEQALHQAVNLTNQLLTFSKGGRPVKKVLALAPLLESAATFSLSGARTTCRIAAAPDLWNVEADAGQLAQVIQNIVLNADQAMPHGGTVEIGARNLPAAPLPPGMAPAAAVEITIRDSGVGIAEGDLPRVFDPYFTTKEGGSGLGLATSHAIVRNHGGTIGVVSAPGKGSTFTILLPASRAPVAAEITAAPAGGGRRGRILFMDDEDVVRQVAVELLGALGHAADAVACGEQVLERYRAEREAGRPYDIVILDLTIRGGMGGLETVRALLEMDPGVRAIVSSGYAGSDAIAEYRRHGFAACLHKPYTAAALREELARLLA
ncbi:MAG TPA: PAS domain S-box protein [bacterium]